MLSSIFWVTVGAFVGWHVPEPEWAKKAKEVVVEKIKDFKESK